MAWTSPRTWLAGEKPTAAIYNTHIRDNFNALGDAWTAYTPAWVGSTTNPTLGNGVLSAAYMNTGKLCIGRIFLTMGSTTTYGSGNYTFSLPFNSVVGAQWFPLGGCVCRDSSPANTYYIGAFTASTSSVSGGNDAASRLSNTYPFTWASGDSLGINFTYETV